jgi:hypothetical protein
MPMLRRGTTTLLAGIGGVVTAEIWGKANPFETSDALGVLGNTEAAEIWPKLVRKLPVSTAVCAFDTSNAVGVLLPRGAEKEPVAVPSGSITPGVPGVAAGTADITMVGAAMGGTTAPRVGATCIAGRLMSAIAAWTAKPPWKKDYHNECKVDMAPFLEF